MNTEDKPLLLILVKRAAILSLVVCAVSMFYWAVGSLSSFLDDTQLMLLGIVRVASLCVISIAALSLILELVFALSHRYKVRAMGIVGYSLCLAFGSAALLASQAVTILFHGLR
jgi:hypothetical protein